jgi:hypothetical protein
MLIVGDQQSRVSYHHFSQDGKVQQKMLLGGHRDSPIVCVGRHENVLFSASKNGIVTLRQFSTGAYIDHFELNC